MKTHRHISPLLERGSRRRLSYQREPINIIPQNSVIGSVTAIVCLFPLSLPPNIGGYVRVNKRQSDKSTPVRGVFVKLCSTAVLLL